MAVTLSAPTVSPFIHQREGIKWLVSHGNRRLYSDPTRQNGRPAKGALLADEMGLGKSVTAAIAAAIHVKADPTLGIVILCPKSVAGNWENELRQAGVSGASIHSWSKQPVTAYTESIRGRDRTNYRPADSLPSRYVLIADEAHFAQNLQAKRTQQFLALSRSHRCHAVYMLTGTPIRNGRALNLFPLLLAARHPLADSLRFYEERYCGAAVRRYRQRDELTGQVTYRQVYDRNGTTNGKELHDLTADFILRRLQKDCPDLPRLLRSMCRVSLSDDGQRTYDSYFDELRQMWRRKVMAREIKGTGQALVLLNNLRRAGSLAKVEAAVELAEEIIGEERAPVIFTEFRETAERISEYLPGNCPVFHGGLSTSQRDKIVADFQAGNLPAFIGTGPASGTGINLQRGRDVILVDRPWTPGDALQWEKRCQRIGSEKGTVNSYWLQYGSADSKIDPLLQRKFSNIELLLSGKRDSLAFESLESMADEIAESVFGAA